MRTTILSTSIFILISIGAILLWQAPHWRLYSVQTASMEPAIHKGSLVFVNSQAPILVNGIASYSQPGNTARIVTHRVKAYDAHTNTYLFKGDANPANDDPVPARSVLGGVNLVVPVVGYAINVLKTPLGLAVGVYLPASLVIIYELSRLAYIKKSYRLNT